MTKEHKYDFGTFRDGFRIPFQFKSISYFRYTAKAYVDIDRPFLSALLFGPLNQITVLVPNVMTALFMFFIFYVMNINLFGKNCLPLKTKTV